MGRVSVSGWGLLSGGRELSMHDALDIIPSTPK